MQPLGARNTRPEQGHAEPQDKPVGRVSAVNSDGSVKVFFPRLALNYVGKTFEVCRKTPSGVMTSLGTGVLGAHGPSHYYLTPGPSGFGQIKVRDVVRIYGG